jgi:hypothetical protein
MISPKVCEAPLNIGGNVCEWDASELDKAVRRNPDGLFIRRLLRAARCVEIFVWSVTWLKNLMEQ